MAKKKSNINDGFDVTIYSPKKVKHFQKTSKEKDNHILIAYNPHIRRLAVYFTDFEYLVETNFDSECEWVYIDHPVFDDQYLAIQLDYDECSQLIVYFEHPAEGESASYSDSVSWLSSGHKNSNFFIVNSDLEYMLKLAVLEKLEFYPKVDELKLKD